MKLISLVAIAFLGFASLGKASDIRLSGKAMTKMESKDANAERMRYDSDPNYRMRTLLNESENFGKANVARHRFWLNNQPSCLSYDRLKGVIGP